MGSAHQWVRGIVSNSLTEPMPTEDVLKSLDKYVGQDERSLDRAKEVLNCLDQELINRNDGPVMRDLWSTVAFYVEKVQEARAAS